MTPPISKRTPPPPLVRDDPHPPLVAGPDSFLSGAMESGAPSLTASPSILVRSLPNAAPPKSVLIFAAGGNAPGQNAFLKSFVLNLIHQGVKVLVADGGADALATNPKSIREMTAAEAEAIDENSGSIVIGTTRKKEAASAIATNIRASGAELTVLIGGDGGLALAKVLSDEGIPTIGVAKSMDGNVGIQTAGKIERLLSIGYLSAVNRAAEYVKRLQIKALAERKIYVLELNGRNTGWIAKATGLQTHTPFFIGEHPATLAKLDQTAESLKKTGGVIIVSESVEFVDQHQHPFPLQNLHKRTLPRDSDMILEEALMALGLQARRTDLAPLLAADPAEAVREAEDAIRKMTASALAQRRINVIQIPHNILVALQKGKVSHTVFLEDVTMAFDELLASWKASFQSGYLATIVVSDDLKLDDLPYKKGFQADTRTRYQTRQVGKRVAAHFIERGIASDAFTATHLLMAEETSWPEIVLARNFALAVTQAVLERDVGVVVGMTSDRQKPVRAPLNAVRDLQASHRQTPAPQAVSAMKDPAVPAVETIKSLELTLALACRAGSHTFFLVDKTPYFYATTGEAMNAFKDLRREHPKCTFILYMMNVHRSRMGLFELKIYLPNQRELVSFAVPVSESREELLAAGLTVKDLFCLLAGIDDMEMRDQSLQFLANLLKKGETKKEDLEIFIAEKREELLVAYWLEGLEGLSPDGKTALASIFTGFFRHEEVDGLIARIEPFYETPDWPGILRSVETWGQGKGLRVSLSRFRRVVSLLPQRRMQKFAEHLGWPLELTEKVLAGVPRTEQETIVNLIALLTPLVTANLGNEPWALIAGLGPKERSDCIRNMAALAAGGYAPELGEKLAARQKYNLAETVRELLEAKANEIADRFEEKTPEFWEEPAHQARKMALLSRHPSATHQLIRASLWALIPDEEKDLYARAVQFFMALTSDSKNVAPVPDLENLIPMFVDGLEDDPLVGDLPRRLKEKLAPPTEPTADSALENPALALLKKRAGTILQAFYLGNEVLAISTVAQTVHAYPTLQEAQTSEPDAAFALITTDYSPAESKLYVITEPLTTFQELDTFPLPQGDSMLFEGAHLGMADLMRIVFSVPPDKKPVALRKFAFLLQAGLLEQLEATGIANPKKYIIDLAQKVPGYQMKKFFTTLQTLCNLSGLESLVPKLETAKNPYHACRDETREKIWALRKKLREEETGSPAWGDLIGQFKRALETYQDEDLLRPLLETWIENSPLAIPYLPDEVDCVVDLLVSFNSGNLNAVLEEAFFHPGWASILELMQALLGELPWAGVKEKLRAGIREVERRLAHPPPVEVNNEFVDQELAATHSRFFRWKEARGIRLREMALFVRADKSKAVIDAWALHRRHALSLTPLQTDGVKDVLKVLLTKEKPEGQIAEMFREFPLADRMTIYYQAWTFFSGMKKSADVLRNRNILHVAYEQSIADSPAPVPNKTRLFSLLKHGIFNQGDLRIASDFIRRVDPERAGHIIDMGEQLNSGWHFHPRPFFTPLDRAFFGFARWDHPAGSTFYMEQGTSLIGVLIEQARALGRHAVSLTYPFYNFPRDRPFGSPRDLVRSILKYEEDGELLARVEAAQWVRKLMAFNIPLPFKMIGEGTDIALLFSDPDYDTIRHRFKDKLEPERSMTQMRALTHALIMLMGVNEKRLWLFEEASDAFDYLQTAKDLWPAGLDGAACIREFRILMGQFSRALVHQKYTDNLFDEGICLLEKYFSPLPPSPILPSRGTMTEAVGILADRAHGASGGPVALSRGALVYAGAVDGNLALDDSFEEQAPTRQTSGRFPLSKMAVLRGGVPIENISRSPSLRVLKGGMV